MVDQDNTYEHSDLGLLCLQWKFLLINKRFFGSMVYYIISTNTYTSMFNYQLMQMQNTPYTIKNASQ